MRKLLCMILCIILLFAHAVPAYANDAIDLPNLEDIIQGGLGLEDLIPDNSNHTHSYDILKNNTATCSEAGTATYACICGAETQMPSEATGSHTYGNSEYVDTTDHKSVCSVCGDEFFSTHSWDQGRMVTEANCMQEGEQIFTCSGCGGTYSRNLAKTGHKYDPAVSDDIYHVCGICGSSESHYWDEGKVTKRPTCREEGTFVYFCSICEMRLTEPLERLKTHTYDSACDPQCNVCGAERSIEHTFTTVWSKNYKGHWHECTKCGEQKDFSKHDPGPEATEKEEQVCLTCKYIIEPKKNHVHQYEKQRSYDEVGHWFACTGCGNEKEYASHSFDDDCDPDCNTCGYERENNHNYEEKWLMSNFEHWNVCTLCGEESRREKHIPGPEATADAAQVCTVCEFEFAPKLEHSHDFGTEWIRTEDSHWQECGCGEQSVPMSHIWDSGRESKKGTIVYTCTECGMEKAVETPSSGFPGMIIILVLLALVCIGGIAALVIIMKRGSFGEEQTEEYEEFHWNDSKDAYQ